MNFKHPNPSSDRKTVKADPCCDTAEEAFAILQEYRDSMDDPIHHMRKAQKSFQYTEL